MLKASLESLIDFHSTAFLVEIRKLVPIQQMRRLSLRKFNLSRFAQLEGETEVYIPLRPLLLILSVTTDKCLPSERPSFPIIIVLAFMQHFLCAGQWALPASSHFLLPTSLSGFTINFTHHF